MTRLLMVLATAQAVVVAPEDPRLAYEGRWVFEDGAAIADWPCSGLRFDVASETLAVTWRGVRSRMVCSAFDALGALVSSTILEGPSLDVPFSSPQRDHVSLPRGAVRVSLKKLTSAAPFSNGVGRVLSPSVISIHGIEADEVLAAAPSSRRIDFVRARAAHPWVRT